MASDNIIIVVTDKENRVVASSILHSANYRSLDNYEQAIAKTIGRFERMYPSPGYAIHQGNGRHLSSFLTVYPELARG